MTASRIYANSLNAQLRQNYTSYIKNSKLGEVETLDFTDPKPVVAKINNWVKDQTQGKISDIVDDKDFGKETALVLINALYFKAPWKHPFNQSDTKTANFTDSDGEIVQVEMMHISEEFPYAELEKLGASAIFLPYKV